MNMTAIDESGPALPGNNGERTMPNVELVEMTRGLRGKGNDGKKIKFQAINEDASRPDNPIEAAMTLVDSDLQKFWDRFVKGYNEYSYEALADPIAAFIDPTWDEAKTKNFRMSVNALAKFTGADKEEIATKLVAQLEAEKASEVTATV